VNLKCQGHTQCAKSCDPWNRMHAGKALRNWKISVKALTKQLWKLTIKTKRLWQLKLLSFVNVNN